MDATATVSFRMDAKLKKKKFESIIQMMGLNMTTAFTVLLSQSSMKGGFPLQLRPIRFGVPRIRRDCVKALLNWN